MKLGVSWAFGTWPALTKFNPRFMPESPKLLVTLVIPNESPYSTADVDGMFRVLCQRRPLLARMRCCRGNESFHATGVRVDDLVHLFEHYLTCVFGGKLTIDRISGVTLGRAKEVQCFDVIVECLPSQRRSLALLRRAGYEFLETLSQ